MASLAALLLVDVSFITHSAYLFFGTRCWSDSFNANSSFPSSAASKILCDQLR